MSNKILNTNNLTSIDDDACEVTSKTIQSMAPSRYIFYNYNTDNCGNKQALNIQTSEVGINFSGERGNIETNVGKGGCLVDNDSKLKFEEMTNKKYINQLTERFNLTVPYVRGPYNVNSENNLVPLLTSTDKPCNALVNSNSKVETHFFTPMVPKLQSEIQNTNYIIPENTDSSWVRGGVSTREIMRNIDYKKRCNNK